MPGRSSWIRWHRIWPREVTYWYGPLQDLKVRINGDTAIVTFHSDQLTEIGGQTTSVHKWQIETHVRRNGRWQLLGIADGLIPREPVTAKIDPSTLDAYVGEAAGGDSSRIVFVKDAAGRVTHYIYREFGASDRIVRKIH